MKKISVAKAAMGVICLLALAACADRYFEDVTIELYTRNFIKEFGLVDPDQDWNMAKAAEVSLDLGNQRAGSVKIYGRYQEKYYLCADLKGVKGKIKVPVDLPKSTEDILVTVDGRNYLGDLRSTIDCTGASMAVSRAESDSPLVGSSNIRVSGHPTDYVMETWTHPTGNRNYTLNATSYTTTTVTIKPTDGAFLGEKRPEAIYPYDRSYQLVNAQQVAPLVSESSWEPNYWSMGSGYTHYQGDHSMGFVPEKGVGSEEYDGTTKGRNNVVGNTKNNGVTQNFTFKLATDKFTVYPMFYGTNLVHILGFYLLDENDLPILDSEGHVLKFPIYKTKQGDDILVKDMSKEIASIGIAQVTEEGKVYISEGATKALSIELYNDKNEAISRAVDYSEVTITGGNTSYFTLDKTAGSLTLKGKGVCTDQPVTISYKGYSYTLYVSVESRNTVYDVRVNNATDTGSGKELTLTLGDDKQEITFDFINGAGEVISGLSTAEKNAAIDALEWTNWAPALYEITRENHKIYAKAKAASYTYWADGSEHTGSDQWSNFYIPGKSEANDYNSLHIFVVDPYADIVLGLVAPDETLVDSDTPLSVYVNGDIELTVVDIKDKNSPTVTALTEAAWARVKIDNVPSGTTLTKGATGHKVIVHGTQVMSGATGKVSLDGYNDKFVEFRVNVLTDPNSLGSFKLVDGTDQEVSSIELPMEDTFDLTLKGTKVGSGDYAFTLADNVQITYDGNSGTYFSVTRKDANTLTVTPLSVGSGTAYIKIGDTQVSLIVTVTDPNRLDSIKIVNASDQEVSSVTLTVPNPQTLKLKGITAGGSEYTFTAADAVEPNYEWGSDSKFTISNNNGVLTLTPLSEGSGRVKLKLGALETQQIEVTVNDPTKLASMKIVDDNDDEVTDVTLYIGTPLTLYLKGTNAGGGTYTFKASDVANVNYNWNASGKFTISQNAGTITLTPIAEITNSGASLSIGNISTQNINIEIKDPDKLTGLVMLNTDDSALPSTISIEPGEYYDIKVKGINGRGDVVDLTPEQYSSLTPMFGGGHGNWDATATYDKATAAKTNSNNCVRITATGVNADGKGFFVEIGDAYSSPITLKTDYLAEHKLKSFTVGNTVTYNYNPALVLKKGTTLAIAINCTNGNDGALDVAYALQQLSLSPMSSSAWEVALVGNYYVITGNNVGSATLTITGGNASTQCNVVVVDSDYEGDLSVSATTNPSGVRKQVAPHAAKTVRASRAARTVQPMQAQVKTVKASKASKAKQQAKAEVKTVKGSKITATKQAPAKPVVKYKPSKKVRYLSAKEAKAWDKKHAKKRKVAPKPYYNSARSRAETIPAALTYDATTVWKDINKTWNEQEDVASFPTNNPLLLRVKGYDVVITGGIPHKKVGLYIDVLDNPDYDTAQDPKAKEGIYYTGLYPTDYSQGYPTYSYSATDNPFNYTHYSQQLLNVYTARPYDHDRKNAITAGTTKFAYSYGCAYRHPVSGRTFFSFEDWPVKHPSKYDTSLTGGITGYDYNERDFWGLNDKDGEGAPPKQKFTGDYSSDRDLNDLVFVVYGAEEVDGDNPFPTIDTTDEFEWLWAIEDLGATDDFDFNDMVMKISTVTRNITPPETSGDDDEDESRAGETELKFYKEVTFKPLCAGGTLPLYVHFDKYTLRPGRWAGDETYAFFEANQEHAAALGIPTDYGHLSDILSTGITDYRPYELHKWFGIDNHTRMINTTSGSHIASQECTIYLCDDHFKDYSFTIANFGGKNSISAGEDNPAKLFVSVNDDREEQYDPYEHITSDWVKSGDDKWTVGAPDKGKVTQMFMILDVNWRWPAERVHILNAYPSFKDWVKDRTHDDWAQYPADLPGYLYSR